MKLSVFSIKTRLREYSVVADKKEAAIDTFKRENPWHLEAININDVRLVGEAKDLLKEYKKQKKKYKKYCKGAENKIASYEQKIEEATKNLKTYSNVVSDLEDIIFDFKCKIEEAEKLIKNQK